MMLVLLLLIVAIFGLITNTGSDDCAANPNCREDFFNPLSIANKVNQTEYLAIQSYLCLAYVVIIIIYFHYFRMEARKLEQDCDEQVDSPSDYAIILKRLPPDISEKDILNMVQAKRCTLSEEDL